MTRSIFSGLTFQTTALLEETVAIVVATQDHELAVQLATALAHTLDHLITEANVSNQEIYNLHKRVMNKMASTQKQFPTGGTLV